MSRAFRNGIALAAAVIAATAAFGRAAHAQTPKASPSPAPAPVAFTAHAHADVTVDTQGGSFAGTVQLGVAQRTSLTRIEILGVKSDTLPMPPIAFTAVIDRRANTITVWNDINRTYRVQSFLAHAASPSPGPGVSPPADAMPRRAAATALRETSPFANLDVLALTMKLTGHTTTVGLPTTGLSFDLQVQHKGDKAPSHVVATTQLADEFAVFPVTLDLSVEPGMIPFSAKLSYALDDLTRETAPLSRFIVPAGYTETRSLADVIIQRRPRPSPSPLPSPR